MAPAGSGQRRVGALEAGRNIDAGRAGWFQVDGEAIHDAQGEAVGGGREGGREVSLAVWEW